MPEQENLASLEKEIKEAKIIQLCGIAAIGVGIGVLFIVSGLVAAAPLKCENCSGKGRADCVYCTYVFGDCVWCESGKADCVDTFSSDCFDCVQNKTESLKQKAQEPRWATDCLRSEHEKKGRWRRIYFRSSIGPS